MVREIKCFICEAPTTKDSDYIDQTCCETHERCNRCGYIYSYEYGHTYEKIGEAEFESHYEDVKSPEKTKDNHRRDAAIETERLKWRHANSSK